VFPLFCRRVNSRFGQHKLGLGAIFTGFKAAKNPQDNLRVSIRQQKADSLARIGQLTFS
jgi:hypothetical protein